MQEIYLVLNDIRSNHNVGSILRTADGFGVRKIYFTGYTPYPTLKNDQRLPHLSLKNSKAIHKTALGAEKNLQLKQVTDIFEALKEIKSKGYAICALEQSKHSVPINKFTPPDKLAIILGNEVDGVSIKTLTACDAILEIPMYGKKESFNVSISLAIALYALKTNYANNTS